MSLSDDQLDRYARHIVLKEVGGAGQQRLLDAHVAVIGAGGIGCPAIQALAAAGVGRLTIIDDDDVALSNLQRQTLFGTADIGRPKALVAAEAVARLNPDVAVTVHNLRLDEANAAALPRGADVILDGCDNFATRLLVSDTAVALKVPLVSAAIGQFHGQIATFRGWEAEGACYRCFVGDAFDAEDCDSCADVGVLGAMSATLGSWAAMETIRALVPFGGEAAGRLHIFDGLGPSLRTIRIPKDPGCRGCSSVSSSPT